MDDECVLHEIDHAVEEARETADARAVAVGEKEQRHHRPERDAPTLRHMEEPQLMQHNRQREHECDIDEHARRETDAAHLQIAEDEDEHGKQGEEAGRLCQQLSSAFHKCVHRDLLDRKTFWGRDFGIL